MTRTIRTQRMAPGEGVVDVALIRPPFEQAGIQVRELIEEPRVVAVGARHPLAGADGTFDEPVIAKEPAR